MRSRISAEISREYILKDQALFAVSCNMRSLALLLSFLFLSLLNAEEVDVYLLGGQSNMQGIGKTKNLDAEQRGLLPHAKFFNGKSFVPINIGITKTSARLGEFGPEVGFSKEMAKDGKDIYLIKHFASGMPLHYGWNGNKWLGGVPTKGRTNFYPGLNASDTNKGKLYQKMHKRFSDGIKTLEAAGHTPNIRGFLWMQGEQDSKKSQSASEYAANLKLLRSRICEDFKTPEIPMVFGQVLPHTPALARFSHREQIRSQMAAADSASGEIQAISGASMISTDNFPLLKDTVHYNAKGQLLLGIAMAKEMTNLHTSIKKIY